MRGSPCQVRPRFMFLALLSLVFVLLCAPSALADESSGSDIEDTANSLDLNVLSMGLNILIPGTFTIELNDYS
ncbi:hypothetical protein N9M68_01955 [Candidatus Poseidonia alphae]|nr:hypothetical protein [Candidatus Poseidonia alphae]MDA8748881.1 hypothetical protein [Candidatus Poseidonia alphae]